MKSYLREDNDQYVEGIVMVERVPEYIRASYPRLEQMPHIGHHHHLCDMAQRGEITLEQMKALVRGGQYICKQCGRVAIKASNLCQPSPL